MEFPDWVQVEMKIPIIFFVWIFVEFDEPSVQTDNPSVARFYTGKLVTMLDELSDEQKLSWHSSSRRIIRPWYKNDQCHHFTCISLRIACLQFNPGLGICRYVIRSHLPIYCLC